MWTARIRHPGICLLFLVLFLFPQKTWAEDGVPTSVELVQPTMPPQPQQPQDRKDGSGAAVALAAVGAAVAGMSCMMMMKEAQATGDKMLMAMAMQQCAQAAQNAANAAQNSQGKDSITSPQGPGEPQLKVSNDNKSPEKEATPNFQMPQTELAAEATPLPQVQGEELASGVVEPTAFDSGLNPTYSGKEEIALKAKGISSSVPDVINQQSVGFDDNAKIGETTPGTQAAAGAGAGFGFGTGTGAANANAAKDLTALLNGSDPRRVRGRDKGETHGEGSGGGGGGSDKGEKSDTDMSAMLAQLMGGGAPAAQADGLSNQVMNLKEFSRPGAEGTEELPNIFQYASYRFRELKREGAMKNLSGIPAPRTTASLASPAKVPAKQAAKGRKASQAQKVARVEGRR